MSEQLSGSNNETKLLIDPVFIDTEIELSLPNPEFFDKGMNAELQVIEEFSSPNASRSHKEPNMPEPLNNALTGKTIVIVGEPTDSMIMDIFELIQSKLKGYGCDVVIIKDIEKIEEIKGIHMENVIVAAQSDIATLHDLSEDIAHFTQLGNEVSQLDSLMGESETDRMFRTGEFIIRNYNHDLGNIQVLRKEFNTFPDRDLDDRFGSKKKGNRRSFGFVKKIGNPRRR